MCDYGSGAGDQKEVVLCIGNDDDDLALIDVTYPKRDVGNMQWFREITLLYHGHRLSTPFVLGLIVLCGHAPPNNWCPWGREGRARPSSGPRHPDPLRRDLHHRLLCLVYQPDCNQSKYTVSVLPFHKDGGRMAQLLAFLHNRRVTVACVGACDVMEKLADEWELDVAWPAELTNLFSCTRSARWPGWTR
uniref:Uncharacterized protein n=1 Tax=Oryza barthii TaxID=65489 RepID=A0A0D3H3H7_9ORYZ